MCRTILERSAAIHAIDGGPFHRAAVVDGVGVDCSFLPRTNCSRSHRLLGQVRGQRHRLRRFAREAKQPQPNLGGKGHRGRAGVPRADTGGHRRSPRVGDQLALGCTKKSLVLFCHGTRGESPEGERSLLNARRCDQPTQPCGRTAKSFLGLPLTSLRARTSHSPIRHCD